MTRLRFATLLLLLFCYPLLSTPRSTEIKRRDGLQSNVVSSIYQDSRGIMWIGSWTGLCDYDGSSFRNVVPDNSEVYGMSPVKDIVEQVGTNYIWSSSSDGVCRIDAVSGETETYLLRSSFKDSPLFNEHVVASSDGHVFVLVNGQGLYAFKESSDMMVQLVFKFFNAASFKNVYCLGDDTLLIVPTDKSLVKVVYSFSDDGNFTIESETRIAEPGAVSFSNINGKSLYIENDGKLEEYSLATGKLDNRYDINPEGLFDVTKDGDEKLLILASDKVYEFIPSTGKFALRTDITQQNILFIYKGSDDVLWVGVDNHGLVKYYDDQLPVKPVFYEPEIAVNAFSTDDSGNMILGTQGNGLILLKNGQRVNTFTTSNSALLSNDISTLSKNGDCLYIGGSGGVVAAAFSHGQLSIKRNLFKEPVHVYVSQYDETCNSLWLGTLTDGVICLPLSDDGLSLRGEPIRFISDDRSLNSLPRNFISSMVLDESDSDYVWVGTLGGYLCHMRKSDGHVDLINVKGRPLKAIICMAYSPDGTLWVGGDALACLGKADKSLSAMTLDNVPADGIHSLASPDGKSIWMTTSKGISRYDVSTGKYYDVADRESLDNDEFLNHSSMITPDGKIYFGASDGYDVVDYNSISQEKQKSSLLIRDFYVRGERRNYELLSDRVVLPFSDNFFEISFSSVDYVNVSKAAYYYRLKGFNNDWVSNGTSRVAVFTNVSPGKYVFEVKNDMDDETPTSLSIVIRRPWYRSIVAIIIYTIIVIAMMVSGYFIYEERRRKKRAAAEAEAEAERQKKNFTSKLDFFTSVAKEFGSSITLIQGYAEQLADRFHLSSKAVEYVKTINDSAGKMQVLIENMSEFRNVGAGQYVPEYEKVNAGSLLKMVISNLGDSRQFDVTIAKQISDHRVISDSNALEKIFSGIISAALKYTAADRKMDVSLDNLPGYGLKFIVTSESDTIRNNDDLSRLVSRYSSLASTEEDSSEIGLALVQNYVSSLDGEFAASMSDNSVIRIEVKIPYAEDVNADKSADTSADDAEDANTFNVAMPLVLVIDPEKEIRTLMTDILNGEFRVVDAFDVDSASAAINEARPDIIVADVMQSAQYDINPLLEKLRNNEITRHIPFIALSYATGNTSYIEKLPYSFDAVVRKPFHPNEFKNTIRRILNSRSDLKDYYNSALSEMDFIAGSAVTSSEKEFSIAVVKIIQENISDTELSPAFIADKMCMSPISLYRKIKSVFSTTPVDLIRSIRLRNAERLLKTTSINISEIMYQSGFNNHSYFNKKFIEAYGMSPKKYRDSQK